MTWPIMKLFKATLSSNFTSAHMGEDYHKKLHLSALVVGRNEVHLRRDKVI